MQVTCTSIHIKMLLRYNKSTNINVRFFFKLANVKTDTINLLIYHPTSKNHLQLLVTLTLT